MVIRREGVTLPVPTKHPFPQQASGQILKDDVNGFPSPRIFASFSKFMIASLSTFLLSRLYLRNCVYAIISLYVPKSSKHEQFAQGYSLHSSSRLTDFMQIPALHLSFLFIFLAFSFPNIHYFLGNPHPFSYAFLRI
jgi:hypothetical protein